MSTGTSIHSSTTTAHASRSPTVATASSHTTATTAATSSPWMTVTPSTALKSCKNKYELSSKYATSEEDAKLKKDYSLLRRMMRGALRHGRTAPNPDEEELPNSMVLDLCKKHPEWALEVYETERPGIQLSPLKFLIHNRARFPILQGFCLAFPQAAQERNNPNESDDVTMANNNNNNSNNNNNHPSLRQFSLDGYPLHLACVTRQEEGALIALLAQQYPTAVSATNDSGFLPLHLLLEYRGLTPSLEGIQALLEQYPQALLLKPPHSSAQMAPLLTCLTAHHISNEIKEAIWKYTLQLPNLTQLQLDANSLVKVTLPIAKAICHVLPQLTHLQWTPQQWAPEAWIYFAARKMTNKQNTQQLQKLILKPPPAGSTTNNNTATAMATANRAGMPFHRRAVPAAAAAAPSAPSPAFTPTHLHRAFCNLLQNVVTLEYLDIQGVLPMGFGTGFAAQGAGAGNRANPFLQQQRPRGFGFGQQQQQQRGFGFRGGGGGGQAQPNNPTWQLLANQGRNANNNNNANAAAAQNPNNNANRSPILDITDPIVHLLTADGSRLKYLKIAGYNLQFQKILQALTNNSTLEQLILNDTVADPPPINTPPGQAQPPLTLGHVLEQYNVTLQKSEVRLVVPRQPSPERQAILYEYHKVKYYTLLNQYGRAVARDQTTRLETILGLLYRAQRDLQRHLQPLNKQLVILGILYGLLRESPGTWSQPDLPVELRRPSLGSSSSRRNSLNGGSSRRNSLNGGGARRNSLVGQQQQQQQQPIASLRHLQQQQQQQQQARFPQQAHSSASAAACATTASSNPLARLHQQRQMQQAQQFQAQQLRQQFMQQQQQQQQLLANRKRKEPPFPLFTQHRPAGKELKRTIEAANDNNNDDDNDNRNGDNDQTRG